MIQLETVALDRRMSVKNAIRLLGESYYLSEFVVLKPSMKAWIDRPISAGESS